VSRPNRVPVTSPIPLRSDTATLPTDEMRAAMAAAEVGDDANRRDPTVRALEELAAGMIGTEAALFLPTGTMGNLVAFLVLTERGDHVFALADAHVLSHEEAMTRRLAGLVPRPIIGDGVLLPGPLLAAVGATSDRQFRGGVAVIENTHNRSGGRVTPPSAHDEAVAMARACGLGVHVDGARIFNAAVALGVPVASLARDADTVTFCLSKGLSAPAGSLLCGANELIEEARRARKIAGGAMRQSGVLAAAGIVALTSMVDRLAEDHRRARRLAEQIADAPALDVEPHRVETNMVLVRLRDGSADEFATQLLAGGVESYPLPPDHLRFVTNRMVADQDIERAATIVRRTAAASQIGKAT
jgi:threonine aldolase